MNRKTLRIALPLLMVVLLAACGGGGHDNSTPPVATTDPPVQDSPADKFIAYLKDLVATALDAAEPLDVSAFDPPPTSEASEPIAAQ